MEAHPSDMKFFHLLVRKQRSNNNSSKLSHLIIDDRYLQDTDEICAGWARYFEHLSQPEDNNLYDNHYQSQLDGDIEAITNNCKVASMKSYTEEEISKVVRSF